MTGMLETLRTVEMPVMALKENPEVKGILFEDYVFVPQGFAHVAIRPKSDFEKTGLAADVLDTFPRDARRWQKRDHGASEWHPGTFHSYGSTLGWAIKNARTIQ